MTGNELKQLRKSRGFAAQQYSDLLGITRMSLYRYEGMEEVPSMVAYATYYLCGHAVLVEYENVNKPRRAPATPPQKKDENVRIQSSKLKTKVSSTQRPPDYQGGDY